MITARTLAYQVLLHSEQHLTHPDRLIRSMLQRHSQIADRDRALLTELVYGVLRWQNRLDWHIDQLSRVKPHKISPNIRILLRLALYQIFFLDRIPHHAAVNEAVNLAKDTQPAHLVSFVNALLRAAIRRKDQWEWPSQHQDPEQFLSVTTAHPLWLIKRWVKELGFAETRALCAANNTVAPMVLRINTLAASTPQVLGELQQQGLNVVPSPYVADSIRISGFRQDIGRHPCFEKGWVQVQDEASQMISILLAPEPGERILDLCSGFGVKATHMAVLMGDQGRISAVDHAAWKLEQLAQNAARQHVTIVEPVAANLLDLNVEELGRFDRVLIDAPCSGFGALRRNPDIKWRRHLKDPYRFSQLQKELLRYAGRFVKQGGILVYATCTMMGEENEAVAGSFSQLHPDFVLESAAHVLPASALPLVEGEFFKSWPHRHGIDGFFAARWRRSA